jgi:putative transposase
MARPLRLEHAGALYHVTARGDRREDIFFENEDRSEFLSILGEVCGRFNWVVHAYCQMTNHYHLLVETVDGNLWRGMRQLNGVYTQRFNRRHGLVGHLFQGRYKAILVQKDTYLLELTRYVVLNPVRARMVADPAEWPWSSYRTVVGEAPAPRWLDTDWLLGQFGGERMPAIGAYRQFVLAGKGAPSPLNQVQHLLGDDAFVVLHQQSRGRDTLREVSKAQRRSVALNLPVYQGRYPDRAEAMARAYFSGAYTMAEIGAHFGVHYMTVSRAVKAFEQRKDNDEPT